MRRALLIALVLFGAASLSCGDHSAPTAPISPNISRLAVSVVWDGQGLPDRLLEILELGLSARTNSMGLAIFDLPPGSYTLRAYVNVGGPAGRRDIPVTIRPGQSLHMDVADCLPCMSP